MSGSRGAKNGEPMAVLILIVMVFITMYWISGLSGFSPIGNSTAANLLNGQYNNTKGLFAIFGSMAFVLVVRGFTMLRSEETGQNLVVTIRQSISSARQHARAARVEAEMEEEEIEA